MNAVVHFELPSEDRRRMADFYTRAFGWKTQMLGPEMNEYVLVTTTESDANGHPKKPGAINGGFYKKSSDRPAQYPSVVIAVRDIKGGHEESCAGGRGSPWRANGDTWLRALRLVLRHGRQPREYDAATSRMVVGVKATPSSSHPMVIRPFCAPISVDVYQKENSVCAASALPLNALAALAQDRPDRRPFAEHQRPSQPVGQLGPRIDTQAVVDRRS
jgi:uncharacterized protein